MVRRKAGERPGPSFLACIVCFPFFPFRNNLRSMNRLNMVACESTIKPSGSVNESSLTGLSQISRRFFQLQNIKKEKVLLSQGLNFSKRN